MPSLHTITEVTPAEFWRHGYRTGYRHCASGWPSLLDDDWETGQPLEPQPETQVIPAPRTNHPTAVGETQ